MIRKFIERCLESVPLDEVMADLACTTRYDRYQASHGIGAAAHYVANRARAVGLQDVVVKEFPGDGRERWWSFRAPRSWTPLVAQLTVHTSGVPILSLDHTREPFALATYSAPTDIDGVRAQLVEIHDLERMPAGKPTVIIADRDHYSPQQLAQVLRHPDVIGFVTDRPRRQDGPDLEYRGRIELDPDTRHFAFSLTTHELRRVLEALPHGAMAEVLIEIEGAAPMPVVSGVLPGGQPSEEIWLTSHLCHPRPGANDNASGVSALLGIAAQLHGSMNAPNVLLHSGRSIRFIWGPEYLGVAAILHELVSCGRALPVAVINLDMVGEDQARCGAPFVIERSSDLTPSLLNPIAEHVVSEIFACTSQSPGEWRSSPFMGFSDHALFADPGIERPAIQFCHVPDRFNHSAADTLDKVSPLEMRRSVAATTALVALLACERLVPNEWLQKILHAWCEAEDSSAAVCATRYATSADRHWGTRLTERVRSQNEALRRHAAARASGNATLLSPSGSSTLRAQTAKSGPINLRALLQKVSPATRAAVENVIHRDKIHLALLRSMAMRSRGCVSRQQLIDDSSLALRRPVNRAVAERLFDALVECSWIEEPGDDPRHHAIVD
jgi:hypothetical protein